MLNWLRSLQQLKRRTKVLPRKKGPVNELVSGRSSGPGATVALRILHDDHHKQEHYPTV